MNKKIILISGKKGSGKSTLCDALKAHLTKQVGTQHTWKFWKQKLPLYETYKYADPLYACQNAIWDIVDKYNLIPREDKSRDLLVSLGDFGRKRDINLWVNITKAAADSSPAPFVLIDDLRFPNEMFVHEQALRIRLECDEDIRKTRCVWGDSSNHVSETALDEYVGIRGMEGEEGGEFDYIFDTGVRSVEEIVESLSHELDFSIKNLPKNIVWTSK